MNITRELDLAIKLAEAKTTEGGYLIGDKKIDTYMTNSEWKEFKSSMLPSALKEYEAGKGGKLSEKNGCPPEMASYGSSGRMIYMLSRHKEDFHYEKMLYTTVGGTTTIDGFYDEEYRYVFVEAKCHEPYTVKNSSVSIAYEKLYNYINTYMPENLMIEMSPSSDNGYMEAVFHADGEVLEHFDLKQMICHLLGIATGILKGELENRQIDFIYLLFDPTELDIRPEAKDTIDSIYERTCYECNLVDFATLLQVIFAFLREEKFGDTISDEGIYDIICKFTFSLASQDFYPILLQ
ncbi:MAG: hypothetical protein IKT70_08235 [Clostridia bacterium]|nr:hypothetical protein [Clostridia bacterium]